MGERRIKGKDVRCLIFAFYFHNALFSVPGLEISADLTHGSILGIK